MCEGPSNLKIAEVSKYVIDIFSILLCIYLKAMRTEFAILDEVNELFVELPFLQDNENYNVIPQ